MKLIYTAIAALMLTTLVSSTDAEAKPRETDAVINGGRYHAVQVPEPSSMLLLGMAISGFIAARRIKKNEN